MVLGCPKHAVEQDLNHWITNILDNFEVSRVIITAFVYDNHRIPLVIAADAFKKIYTTKEVIQILHRLTPSIADCGAFHPFVLSTLFRADCGFQAVGPRVDYMFPTWTRSNPCHR